LPEPNTFISEADLRGFGRQISQFPARPDPDPLQKRQQRSIPRQQTEREGGEEGGLRTGRDYMEGVFSLRSSVFNRRRSAAGDRLPNGWVPAFPGTTECRLPAR